MTALDDVRVEVAFSSDPSSTDPTWNDLTSRARLDSEGISITRGRLDEFGSVSPGLLRVAMDNTDGYLTPSNASSPYYPDVKPNNRVRVTYRDSSVDGNFVDSESATFEGGTVGSWAPGGSVPPTLSASTAQAHSGTYSLLVTWGTGGSFPLVSYAIPKLIMGRVYTASLWVYVPTGSPAVTLVLGGEGVFGSGSSTNDAWEQISVTWTASTNSASLQLWPATAPTSGDLVYMDEAQVDEGSSVRTFTTTAPPITYRFDGFVESWPVSWPRGGQEESIAVVTAYDLQSRLSRYGALGSVIDETYKSAADLVFHYPLDESGDTVTGVTDSESGAMMDVVQQGTGGEVLWANATGPGTDGTAAPTFTPASGEGFYLRTQYPFGQDETAVQTIMASFTTTASADEIVVELVSGSSDQRLVLGVSSTGNGLVEMAVRDVYGTGVTTSSGSATVLNDGATHTIMAVSKIVTATWTVDVYFDGVYRTTMTDLGAWTGSNPPLWSTMRVANGTVGDVTNGWTTGIWSGAVSHIAGWSTDPGSSGAADANQAGVDGFDGDTVDARIQRIAGWIGLNSSFLALATSTQTMGHVDSTGMTPWDYMTLCGLTDGGLVFVSSSGVVTFYTRDRLWDVSAANVVSVTAEEVSPDVAVPVDLQRIVNRSTVTRSSDDASAVARSSTSLAAYGEFGQSEALGVSDAGELKQRASWNVNVHDEPVPYVPQLELDALTSSVAASVRTLDIWDRVAVTSLPSQSPLGTGDLRVEGYIESISRFGWLVSCNTVRFLTVNPLTLDDTTYGVLGATADNRLTF